MTPGEWDLRCSQPSLWQLPRAYFWPRFRFFLYVLFAYVALAKADMVAPLVNQGFTDVFSWVLTAYFAAGIVLTESPAANRNASS